mgnify:FL=1
MPVYDAGAARATYSIDTTAAERSLAAMAKRLQDFEALQKRALGGAGASQPAITAEQVKFQQALAKTAAAEARLAAEATKRAQVDQRAAKSAADAALSEQRRQTELAKTTNAEARAAASTLRLQQQRERAARQSQNGGLGPALPRTFAGFTPGGLAQAAGAFGLATIGPQVVGAAVGAAVDASRNAIQLEQTQNVLKQLSGTQERYNTLVRIAGENQRLFGGSLQENLNPLSSVLALSNQTGASLTELNKASQLLLAKAPTKNAGDAFFGLGEFLSGTGAEAALSLADQFNLPKKALAELAKEGTTAAERLAGLQALLAAQGVNAQTLSARLTDSAKAYNAVNTELDTLKNTAGAALADAFTPAADGLARIVGLINGNPEAIAQLQALLSGKPVTAEGIQQAAQQVAERTVGSGIDAGGELALRAAAQGDALANEAQFSATQARLEEAKRQALELAAVSPEATDAVARFAASFAQTGELDVFIGRLELLRVAQEQAALTSDASVPGYLRAGEAQRQQAADAEAAAAALEAQAQASAQQAVQSEIARAQSELQAITLRDLQAAAQAAADGSGSIEQAAAALAAQFPVTAEEAAKLIGLLRELADAGNEADRSSGVALRNAENQYRLGRQNEDPAARALREQEERLAGAAAGLAQRRAAEERARLASRGGGRGISAADKDTIDAASTLQGELEAVNALLERGNLTVHQRNDLLEKQRDLQEKIADLTLDTALAAARDQQKRIEENRTLAQNKAIIEGAQFSAEQKAAAQAETNVILLEQQKRARDLARDAADAGIAPAGAALPAVPGAPTALPNLPAVPNLPQFALPTAAALVPPQINVNLAVNIQDKQVTSVQADPGVIVRALVNGGALAGAATGAMP